MKRHQRTLPSNAGPAPNTPTTSRISELGSHPGAEGWGRIAAPRVPDAIWVAMEPWLPQATLRPEGERPRVADRVALAAFGYRDGLQRRDLLPAALEGHGAGVRVGI